MQFNKQFCFFAEDKEQKSSEIRSMERGKPSSNACAETETIMQVYAGPWAPAFESDRESRSSCEESASPVKLRRVDQAAEVIGQE